MQHSGKNLKGLILIKLMSGSCHLNVVIDVECQIYVIVVFLTVAEFYNLGHIQGIIRLFHVGWKNQNKHSTLNSSFDALLKWHDPHIRTKIISFQGCFDNYAKCPEWSLSGACGINPEFMAFNCRESCGACGFKSGMFKSGILGKWN